MAFRRRRRQSDSDPFTDLLFNALLGFTFMFLIAVFFLNPPTQTGEIPAKAEYIITATWEAGRPDDVDLWVQNPNGKKVWYLKPESDLMNLDRDDRGLINDEMVVDGQTITNELNQEIVSLRARAPGEYVVNVHYYHSETGRPITVDVSVTRVNPRLQVAFKGSVALDRVGQEKTALRFTIEPDGAVTGINTLQKSLVQ